MYDIGSLFKRNVEFLKEISRECRPEWFSKNKIILKHTAFNFRQFSKRKGEIYVVTPPQAGHSSTICDFYDGQSLVQTIMSTAKNPTICAMDYKPCTSKRKNEGFEDLIIQLLIATNTFKKPFNLIGLCQGGWLNAMFTAIFPNAVKHLIVGGAPINAKAGGGYIQTMLPFFSQEYFKYLVALNGGVMKGDYMLNAWKMMHPLERMMDYGNLWFNIVTEKFEKDQKFRNWYEYTQDIAGRYFLRAVEDIFHKNLLWFGKLKLNFTKEQLKIIEEICSKNEIFKKRLELIHKPIDLKNITCNITSIAGENDDITLKEQALALPGKHIIIPEVGHIGLFMSHKAQKYWKEAII